jgi:hypothetical protein
MVLFAFLLFVTTLLDLAHAAPFPVGEKALSWESEPNTRGTLSILFSCATALILCVWTGVHLNVDPIEKKRKLHVLPHFSKFLGKTLWAMIALVAPDIVLVIALHQLLVAIEYRDAVNRKSTTKTNLVGKEIPPRRRTKMTLKTAFFAIMGGFSIEVNTVEGPKKYSLKVKNIDNIGMMDRIHDFPLPDIEDKSKASGIAKFVVCVQSGWILLHCFGREMNGIYITLLELDTAVHVMLAIAMYCIWWEKPADIDRPIIIDRRGMYLTSSAYRNCVQQVLEWTGGALDLDDIKKQPIIEENGVRGHKEAWVTALVCGTIKDAPEKTALKVQRIPDQIGKYFRAIVRRDIRDGVLEYHRDERTGPIPLAVVQASFGVAFKVAHKNAFKVAQKLVYDTVYQIASDNPSDTELEAKLQKALDKACTDTYKVTFQAAFKAAFTAGSLVNERTSTSADPSASTADQSASTANPSASMSLHPMSEKSVQTKGSDHASKIVVAVKAAFRAANAATRCATRQAVRLAVLNAALDKTTAAAASGTAFHEVIIAHCQALGVDHTKIEPDIKLVVQALERTVEEAFRDQYRTGTNRANIGSDVNATCELVKEATFTGIWNAAKAEIEIARDKTDGSESEIAKACIKAEEELKALEGPEAPDSGLRKRSAWKRLSRSIRTASDVVGGQLIHVPGLFWRQEHGDKGGTSDNGGTGVVGAGITNAGRMGTAIVLASTGANGAMDSPEDSVVEVSEGTSGAEGSKGDVVKVEEADADGSSISDTDEHYIGDILFNKHWRKMHRTILLFFAAIVGAFYGALHLTKWNDGRIPTETEQLLWRMSCCVGSATVLPVALLAFVPFVRSKPLRIICIIICALSWTAFLAARAYIIVESFISLRALPKDAFSTVQWTDAIPHI